LVVKKYQHLIRDFDDWFFRKVKELYSKELSQLSKVDSEIQKLAEEGFVHLDN
jgi:hypothetical protein